MGEKRAFIDLGTQTAGLHALPYDNNTDIAASCALVQSRAPKKQVRSLLGAWRCMLAALYLVFFSG